MNTVRFETFAPIRRRATGSKLSSRRASELQLERRKREREEKARRCGRVAA